MATVKFYLNHPYKKGTKILRDDEVSIDLVLTVNRDIRPRIPTGERVKPKYWNKKDKEVKPNCKTQIEINSRLTELKTGALGIWRANPSASKEVFDNLLKKLVSGISDDQPQVIQEDPTQKKTSLFTVGRFIAQCKKELDSKTVNRYRVLWRALGRYLKGKTLDLSILNMSFHDGFKNFLYDIPNPNYNGYHLEYNSNSGVYVVTPGAIPGKYIGLLDEVVFKYLVQFKTFCDWASERGYRVNESYKTWKTIKREYPPISLSKAELERIEDLPQLGVYTIKKLRGAGRKSDFNINLDSVRDILIIACRSGQRISDIRRFKAIQVVGSKWTFTQKKGNRTKIKTIEIPLVGFCSTIKLILEKYNYELPKISEASINIGIKEIARRAGITEPMFIERWAGEKKIRIQGTKNEFLSTHTGKKSFITILAGLGVPVKVISDLTGTSIRTIERHYLGKTDLEVVGNYLEQAGGKTVMRKAQ